MERIKKRSRDEETSVSMVCVTCSSDLFCLGKFIAEAVG